MTANGWLQILLFLALVFFVTKPMGIFMTRVFQCEKTFMDPMLRPVELALPGHGRGPEPRDAMDRVCHCNAAVQLGLDGRALSDI